MWSWLDTLWACRWLFNATNHSILVILYFTFGLNLTRKELQKIFRELTHLCLQFVLILSSCMQLLGFTCALHCPSATHTHMQKKIKNQGKKLLSHGQLNMEFPVFFKPWQLSNQWQRSWGSLRMSQSQDAVTAHLLQCVYVPCSRVLRALPALSCTVLF